MNLDQNDLDLLDQYHKGLLTTAEIRHLFDRAERDPEFGKEVRQYLELMGAIKLHHHRTELKGQLDVIHNSLQNETEAKPTDSRSQVWMFNRYWKLTAVAASIVVVSVVGTLLLTQSLNKERTAEYRELRRNVEQIRKSQRQIMADLREAKDGELRPGKYSGTGFLISSAGYLATSYHVIRESDSVIAENETYGRLKAKIVYSDPSNDIAILQIVSKFKLKTSLPFTISGREADLGENVYTLGYPREDIVFGEGSISASSGFQRNQNAYQISVPVNPGNSGGPLLNAQGDLIGMVSGLQTETMGTAFAIKSTTLLTAMKSDAIDTLSTRIILPKVNTLKNSNRVQQIKRWKDLVFMIDVYKEK